jgi:hypothetical protein
MASITETACFTNGSLAVKTSVSGSSSDSINPEKSGFAMMASGIALCRTTKNSRNIQRFCELLNKNLFGFLPIALFRIVRVNDFFAERREGKALFFQYGSKLSQAPRLCQQLNG